MPETETLTGTPAVSQTGRVPYRRPELSSSAQALLDAVVAISSDLDLTSVLQRIVEAACQLTDARYGAVGVIGGDGMLAEFITHGLDPHEREEIGAPPHGRGILGLLIKHPEPLRLQDLSQHPESYGFPPNHPPMRSFLGVPVRIRGAVFGNLYLTEKAHGEFHDDDVLLVEALASAAGFVIENARAYTLSERRRQWLQATAELVDGLQPPLDMRTALQRIGATRVVWVKSAPWKYLATLRVICGVEVVEFTDNPSRDQLAQVARAWGGALVVLSEDPTPLGFDPNSVPFAPNVVGTQWERRISGPPRAVLTRNDAVWAWSLAPDGSLTQLSAPTP